MVGSHATFNRPIHFKYINTLNNQPQLIAWIEQDSQLMSWLSCLETLRIPQACIGAGAIRNFVWDKLHGYRQRTPLNDVDVVYFDDADLAAETEQHYTQLLKATLPEVPWEVVNQARVHQWYVTDTGQAVPPLQSVTDGIATWPETATCVGAYLEQGQLRIIAPHGLNDLFNLTLRHNPTRVSHASYQWRQSQKKFHLKWPKLTQAQN